MKLQFQNVPGKSWDNQKHEYNQFPKARNIFYLFSIIYFQKDFEGCLKKAQKSSAFQLGFQKDGGLYFQHGHSRCLSNGNYDPIQCVDLSGDTDLWYFFFSAW